jgi:hypothetical protein
MADPALVEGYGGGPWGTTPAMLMRYTHLHVDPIAAKLAA